ncbi:kinase-like protein [Aspergillus ellipticus CBS 707.79]|uniref:Kinase-like protein n=1 Tax=Aspergillus ellipticus CBS 707.79 TaxID=1448320 RepID=A0A319D4X9_9EURO|nr:kinase-like protein [Aspergillus ellipticus CBS 707.79]
MTPTPLIDRPPVPDTSSEPYNDSALNRYSTLLAIKLLGSFRPRRGGVLMLTDQLCVKYGWDVHLSEASTLRFVAQHTTIPVPRVFCAFTRRNCTYIVMERIKGEVIGRGWVRRSEESKARLLSKLRRMIEELRQIPAPKNIGIASVDAGPLYDCRVPGPTIRFGPFKSMQDFHRHLRTGMDFDPELDHEVQELMRQHKKEWPLVFTHGDLSSLNVMVREDDVVGIIDWETSGWYPSYWEYTTACQVNPQNSFWADEIDKFLTPMPEELAMEHLRQKYFGLF